MRQTFEDKLALLTLLTLTGAATAGARFSLASTADGLGSSAFEFSAPALPPQPAVDCLTRAASPGMYGRAGYYGYYGGCTGGYYGSNCYPVAPSLSSGNAPVPATATGSPGEALSPAASPDAAPAASPAASTDTKAPAPAPSSPSRDGGLGASPNPPPPASFSCRGVAYDGYLSACTLFLDASGDGQLQDGELSATIVNGSFALTGLASVSQLAPLYVVPAERIRARVRAGSTSVCHDIATLLPQDLPLAAPRPDSCNASLVVSPLTTLLALAPEGSGLSEASLKAALGLPSNWSLLTTDALKAAVQGSAAAKQVLSVELQLKQAVASGAGLLAAPGSSAVYKVLARRMFREFASRISGRAAQASAAPGRRLAQSAPGFSFSNTTLLQELLTAVQTLASADPAISGQLANITNVTAVVQATANAIAALNEVVASAPSVEFMQKAMVVAQTLLVDQVQALANGTLSTEQFQAATSASAVTEQIQQATLPGVMLADQEGSPVDPLPAEGTNDNKKASTRLGLGLGLGLGLPVLALAAWAAAALRSNARSNVRSNARQGARASLDDVFIRQASSEAAPHVPYRPALASAPSLPVSEAALLGGRSAAGSPGSTWVPA
ncbi:hypothetical protein ABPG75_007002 [Micractinium tetrahymenae]